MHVEGASGVIGQRKNGSAIACDMLCRGALPLEAVQAAWTCKVPELTLVSNAASNEHHAIVASKGQCQHSIEEQVQKLHAHSILRCRSLAVFAIFVAAHSEYAL
jgi:hypothetical protein